MKSAPVQETPTKFAPAHRSSSSEITQESKQLSQYFDKRYFEYFPLPVLILNAHRQIVFGNQPLLNILGLKNMNSLLGMRPGEAMGCVYSTKYEGGCGVSENCRQCGAVLAILDAIGADKDSQYDCQLLQDINGETQAKDLRVFVKPLHGDNISFYVMTILDIEDEKRRQLLERIFFHDLLNTAGGAHGLVDIAYDGSPESIKEPLDVVRSALHHMVDEIQKHKQLLELERGDYTTSPITLQGMEIVETLISQFQGYARADAPDGAKHAILAEGSENVVLKTDYTLLRRVLVNMLKNALEATQPHGTVAIGVRPEPTCALFWVRNDALIPENVQVQIFKRSFSTKGVGRGVGTYAMRLLTNNYLGGQVGFTSTEQEGTTFWVRVPVSAPS